MPNKTKKPKKQNKVPTSVGVVKILDTVGMHKECPLTKLKFRAKTLTVNFCLLCNVNCCECKTGNITKKNLRICLYCNKIFCDGEGEKNHSLEHYKKNSDHSIFIVMERGLLHCFFCNKTHTTSFQLNFKCNEHLKQNIKSRIFPMLSIKKNSNVVDISTDTQVPVGLQNRGNTCYINSSLQCLYNCLKYRDLLDHMETHGNTYEMVPRENCDNSCVPLKVQLPIGMVGDVSRSLKALFDQMTPFSSYAVSRDIVPYLFLNSVWKNMCMFVPREEHDAHEFILSLINQICHEEQEMAENYGCRVLSKITSKKETKSVVSKELISINGEMAVQPECLKVDQSSENPPDKANGFVDLNSKAIVNGVSQMKIRGSSDVTENSKCKNEKNGVASSTIVNITNNIIVKFDDSISSVELRKTEEYKKFAKNYLLTKPKTNACFLGKMKTIVTCQDCQTSNSSINEFMDISVTIHNNQQVHENLSQSPSSISDRLINWKNRLINRVSKNESNIELDKNVVNGKTNKAPLAMKKNSIECNTKDSLKEVENVKLDPFDVTSSESNTHDDCENSVSQTSESKELVDDILNKKSSRRSSRIDPDTNKTNIVGRISHNEKTEVETEDSFANNSTLKQHSPWIFKSNTPDLNYSLTKFFSQETMDVNNKLHCITCSESQKTKVKTIATVVNVIEEIPEIIMIHCKRFKADSYDASSATKIKNHIKFDTELDMGRFCSSRVSKRYELIALIEHLGDLKSGHYVAYVKKKLRSQNLWYLINDNTVEVVSESDVLESKAYLLFYSQL